MDERQRDQLRHRDDRPPPEEFVERDALTEEAEQEERGDQRGGEDAR